MLLTINTTQQEYDNSEAFARAVKARVERTTLSQIAAYVRGVYSDGMLSLHQGTVYIEFYSVCMCVILCIVCLLTSSPHLPNTCL